MFFGDLWKCAGFPNKPIRIKRVYCDCNAHETQQAVYGIRVALQVWFRYVRLNNKFNHFWEPNRRSSLHNVHKGAYYRPGRAAMHAHIQFAKGTGSQIEVSQQQGMSSSVFVGVCETVQSFYPWVLLGTESSHTRHSGQVRTTTM